MVDTPTDSVEAPMEILFVSLSFCCVEELLAAEDDVPPEEVPVPEAELDAVDALDALFEAPGLVPCCVLPVSEEEADAPILPEK